MKARLFDFLCGICNHSYDKNIDLLHIIHNVIKRGLTSKNILYNNYIARSFISTTIRSKIVDQTHSYNFSIVYTAIKFTSESLYAIRSITIESASMSVGLDFSVDDEGDVCHLNFSKALMVWKKKNG